MSLSVAYQPKVKDASSVLVGIAQLRIGLPSVRTGTAAVIKAVQAVGKSDVATDVSDGTTEYVVARNIYTANGGSGTLTASGQYTGTVDGCFILRLTGASAGKLYAPDGDVTTVNAVAPVAVTADGVTFGGTITGGAAGDTWVIPVWADSTTGISKVQTGIVSPFSMFSGANESVGGLRSCTLTPKIDDQKTLSSGFPETTDDTMIVKTSVDIAFEALEYDNIQMSYLKDMVFKGINQGLVSSVAVEVVMRTRGGNLRTFWCPTTTINNYPAFGPGQDYSSFSYGLSANKMTEITGASATYNAFLRNTPVFQELAYLH
jgi:hypothetical protein